MEDAKIHAASPFHHVLLKRATNNALEFYSCGMTDLGKCGIFFRLHTRIVNESLFEVVLLVLLLHVGACGSNFGPKCLLPFLQPCLPLLLHNVSVRWLGGFNHVCIRK